jgi:CCR4-NOT transcription complex subunit 3
MAANRKLQTEIQQVLKKVDEGVELFDEIWGKVYAAEQQSLKEKYENDLKKEIKKLQRLRDQIKSWISSNDIKDKAQLVEARKTIETKMEMFKVCEKDTKTKAYSKEGLAREARIDPKDQLKEEKRSWLNDCLEKLHDLNTLVDGEKEKLSGGKSKLKNKDALEKLDNRIQKHKWHISRIELIIRLLENDELDPSLLDSIKDSLEYYLETATEDDGALGVEHEFDIYEDLELDQYVNNFDVTKPVAETQNVVDTDKDKDGDEREVAKLQVVKVITNNTSTKITDVKTKTDSTPKTETDDVKMPVKSDHDSGEVKQPALATSKVSKAIVVDAKLVEHATNVSPNPVANVQIPAATQGVQPSSATHTSPPTSIPPTTATPPTPQSSTPQSLQIASSVSNNSFMNPELQVSRYIFIISSYLCSFEILFLRIYTIC